MSKNIVFTGGSGKAGRHVVQHLVEHGYNVLNLDRKPLDNPKVRTLITDITDAGQVFNALTATLEVHEFAPSLRAPRIDAVVHFAAIPRIMLVPDNETFRINTMGTYSMIEAAEKLGIRKTIIASSETTYGLVFANEPRDPAYFPLDEEYPVNPMDSYALSKICNERTAHAFQQRSGADVYAIRIGNVIEPHEYADFPTFFADPGFRKRIAWSYIDARDLGQIIRLGIEHDGLGFQIFNAAQNDCSSDLPTAELLERFYPGVPLRGAIGEYDSLLSNRKVRAMLGFEEQHNWRKYVPASGKGAAEARER